MASNRSGAIGLLTGPHQMLSRLDSSSTRNLSFAERPVYVPVSTTSAPPSETVPRPRFTVSS
jgi:hypothetical protein